MRHVTVTELSSVCGAAPVATSPLSAIVAAEVALENGAGGANSTNFWWDELLCAGGQAGLVLGAGAVGAAGALAAAAAEAGALKSCLDAESEEPTWMQIADLTSIFNRLLHTGPYASKK